MPASKEQRERVNRAYEKLAESHVKAQREEGYTLSLACFFSEHHVTRWRELTNVKVCKQRKRIEIDWEGETYDYVPTNVPALKLKALRLKNPHNLDTKSQLKCETGLHLVKADSCGAKHGSARDTEEINAKRVRQNTDAQQGLNDRGIRKVYDGSKGGIGYHDHGHCEQETKESKLVEAMQAHLAPDGCTDEEVLVGRVECCAHYLSHLEESGELPEDMGSLRGLLGTANANLGHDLAYLLAKTLDKDSEVTTFDLEGKVTNRDLLGGLTELGATSGSLAGVDKPSAVLDVRSSRGSRLDRTQQEAGAKVLTMSEVVLHHAGSDAKVLAAFSEEFDLPLPKTINVHAVLAVALGRRRSGERRPGFSKDGVGLGMETLVYILKTGRHSHHGSEDACMQHICWRPMLIALRRHYWHV